MDTEPWVNADKKPCPFCGGVNLSITCDVKQGHGDCSYDGLRVVCAECKATNGISNWGVPDKEGEQRAWDAWNKRV